MKSIRFNTGIREYAVNGNEAEPLRINISDINLMKRVTAAQAELTELREKYSGKLTAEQLIAADTDVRGIIDRAFAADVCRIAFGEANVFSPVEGGKMLFEAFFEAFLPVLREDMQTLRPQAAARPEITRYLPQEEPAAVLAKPYGDPIPDVSGLTEDQRRELIARLLA